MCVELLLIILAKLNYSVSSWFPSLDFRLHGRNIFMSVRRFRTHKNCISCSFSVIINLNLFFTLHVLQIIKVAQHLRLKHCNCLSLKSFSNQKRWPASCELLEMQCVQLTELMNSGVMQIEDFAVVLLVPNLLYIWRNAHQVHKTAISRALFIYIISPCWNELLQLLLTIVPSSLYLWCFAFRYIAT